MAVSFMALGDKKVAFIVSDWGREDCTCCGAENAAWVIYGVKFKQGGNPPGSPIVRCDLCRMICKTRRADPCRVLEEKKKYAVDSQGA